MIKAARYPASDLQPGDTYQHEGITVTVVRGHAEVPDLLGRRAVLYYCRRGDTGAEGWVLFGPEQNVHSWRRP